MMAQQQQHLQQQLNQQQNGQIKFSPPGNIQQMLRVNQDLVDNDENFNQTSPKMNIQQQSPTAQYMQQTKFIIYSDNSLKFDYNNNNNITSFLHILVCNNNNNNKLIW
jgi:outer membrane lipoprotein-sorting protein